ncbi:MAG: hypothetical protein FWE11_02650 [Defluviitaleaceae bacterium]|nr:hypothetical protein [Defluviitaleaceae bacterium]
MGDIKLIDTLISALTDAKKQDTNIAIESQINPESEVSDIHNKVSMAAINTAAAIYTDWSDKEKKEISQRKSLTVMMFSFLVGQWIVAVVLIVLQGVSILDISETIFISFFAAIIIQTIAIVLAMVVYLYKERSSTPLNILGNLISIAGLNNVQYKNTVNGEYSDKKAVDKLL